MRVSLVYMSYDKHIYINSRYPIYLSLEEQLLSFIKKKEHNVTVFPALINI
jgi:hypothetical protein